MRPRINMDEMTYPELTKQRIIKGSIDEMMHAYNAKTTTTKKLTALERLEHLGQTKDFVSANTSAATETCEVSSDNDPTHPKQLNTIILAAPRLNIGFFINSNNSAGFFKKIKKLKLRIKATTAEEMATYKFSVEELILNLSLITPIIHPNTSLLWKKLASQMTLLRNNILNSLSPKKLKLLRSSLKKKKALIGDYWNRKRTRRGEIDYQLINYKVSSLISTIKAVIKEKNSTENANSTQPISSALAIFINKIETREPFELRNLFQIAEQRGEILKELLQLPATLNNEKYSIADIVIHLMILRVAKTTFIDDIIKQILKQLDDDNFNIVVNETQQHFTNKAILSQFVNHSSIKSIIRIAAQKIDIEKRTEIFSEIIRQAKDEKEKSAMYAAPTYITEPSSNPVIDTSLSQSDPVLDALAEFTAPAYIIEPSCNPVIDTSLAQSDPVMDALAEFTAPEYITEPSCNPVIDTSLSQSDPVMDALAEFTAPPPIPTHRAPLTSVRTRRTPSSTTFMMQELSTDVAPMSYASATQNPMQESVQMLVPFNPETWCIPSTYFQGNHDMYGFFGTNTPPQSTSTQPSDQSQHAWLPNA